MADPVDDELVASLSRPGGNVTGTTFLGPELTAKRMGLLKEAIPKISRVGVLWHPGAYGKRTTEGLLNETKSAALALGWQIQLVATLLLSLEEPHILDCYCRLVGESGNQLELATALALVPRTIAKNTAGVLPHRIARPFRYRLDTLGWRSGDLERGRRRDL
jgi:hypothetical protein